MARSVACLDRSTDGPLAQTPGDVRRAVMRSIELADVRMATQRVVGELEVVSLAHEDAQRALAFARGRGHDGEAAPQQRERRLELLLMVLGRECAADLLGAHP